MNRPFPSTPDRSPLKGTPLLLLVGDVPEADTLGLRARLCRLSDTGSVPPRADLVLVRAADLDAADLSLFRSPALRDVPFIVFVNAGDADHAGALMEFEVAGFLPTDCALAEIEALVQRTLDRGGFGVADTSRSIDPRLEAIKREVERMTAAIAAMARETDALQPPPVSAGRIRAHIKARRLRETFFPAGLFADPAWDILLDLGAARREGRPVSVSSLCIAAAVPTTTALRWIKTMVDGGMLLRRADSTDARRAFIELAPATSETLDRCLEATFNVPGL